jgi:Domain of unknown function (DUF4352)
VPVGFLGYKVYRSWFADKPPPGSRGAGARFLYVDLGVVNTDRKPRGPAVIKVLSEKGQEYLSKIPWSDARSGAAIPSLAPSASARGHLVFEIQTGTRFQLEVIETSPADSVRIELAPASKEPAL